MEFDADMIDDRVWLGSLAAMENTKALETLHITHILSLIKSELPTDGNEKFIRKHLYVEDEGITDLISEFDSCYSFIDQALSENPNNNILIHCQVGMSRSATIACMWLMRRHGLSTSDALKQLKLKRPIVQPNLGFSAQLYLFEQMNNRFDANHSLYKEFHLERARAIYIDHDVENEGIEKKHHLRQNFRQSFTLPHGHASCIVTETYVCRQCQTELFTNADLSRHSEGVGNYDWFAKHAIKQQFLSLSEQECHKKLFTHYLEWVMAQIDTPDNAHSASLTCPHCSAVVGCYDLSGAKCPCGRWVEPAFDFDFDKIEQKIVTKISIETKHLSS